MSAVVVGLDRPGVSAVAGAGAEVALPDVGLLTDEELAAVLRAALGDAVTGEQLEAAVALLRTAEVAKWEQLPPEIHPDVGFNYNFLRCTTSCWLGYQILVEGVTFRIFRLRA